MLMGFQWDLVALMGSLWHFFGGNTNDYMTSELEEDSSFSDKHFCLCA